MNEIKVYTMENFNRGLDVDDNILMEYKQIIETQIAERTIEIK